jgi:hypothetical protein
MLDMTLGRFGDRRLEKGGPSSWVVWWRWLGKGFGFAGLVAIGREKSG